MDKGKLREAAVRPWPWTEHSKRHKFQLIPEPGIRQARYPDSRTNIIYFLEIHAYPMSLLAWFK